MWEYVCRYGVCLCARVVDVCAYMVYVWLDPVCKYACLYSQEPTSVNQPHPHKEFYIYNIYT